MFCLQSKTWSQSCMLSAVGFIKSRNSLGEGGLKEAFFNDTLTNTFIVFCTLFSVPNNFPSQLPPIPTHPSVIIYKNSSKRLLCLLPSTPTVLSTPACPFIVPYSSHHIIVIVSLPHNCKLREVRTQVLYPQHLQSACHIVSL